MFGCSVYRHVCVCVCVCVSLCVCVSSNEANKGTSFKNVKNGAVV